jgi:hypothetical protein
VTRALHGTRSKWSEAMPGLEYILLAAVLFVWLVFVDA